MADERSGEIPQDQGTIRELVGYCRPPVAHRFRRGVSGNPGGRPKGQSITARLRELLDGTELDGKPLDDGRTIGDLVAETIVSGCLNGDIRFLRELLDRLEGKVGVEREKEGVFVLAELVAEAERLALEHKPAERPEGT